MSFVKYNKPHRTGFCDHLDVSGLLYRLLNTGIQHLLHVIYFEGIIFRIHDLPVKYLERIQTLKRINPEVGSILVEYYDP